MEKVVVLDDSIFWSNGGFFPASSFTILPSLFGRTSGWGIFLKGAASVVVCSALVFTARRYLRRGRHSLRRERTDDHSLPNGNATTNHVNHISPDRRRRLVVTPSNSRPTRPARHKQLSSEIATVNFAESDSENEIEDTTALQGVAVEVIPVEDEVEREADDESSELEESSRHYKDGILDRENSSSSPIPSGSLLAEDAEPVDEISEFCLTFESDSTISEPDLSLVTQNRDGSFRNSRIVMDLGSNGHVPTGFVDDKRNDETEDGGGDGRREEGVAEGRRVSLDDLRTSVIEDIDSSNVVVTQAVVSLS